MSESQHKSKILIVDDKPQNLFALEKLLLQLKDVEVVPAESGFTALELTLDHEFCLAIVDIQMPEMDGYELVGLLRGNPSTASLPVIFISAIYSDEYHHRKGYDAGAVDFLSKPFVPEILLSKVKVFLALYEQKMQLEELVTQQAKLYEVEKQLRSVEEARAQDLVELNASKDRFFSIVSHDLRTPFNGLMGNAQLMQMILDEGETHNGELKELADTIYYSAKSAHQLLENLLTWSMLQRGVLQPKLEAFDVKQLVEASIELLTPSAQQKEIKLTGNFYTDVQAYADMNMISTILRNLISNAIKFTSKFGKITVSARAQTNLKGTAEFIELTVEDTGVGISEMDLDKLFRIDVHHTTKGTAQEEGAGLGLILCKEMIESHNGRLTIKSDLGKGTKITFTLPVVPPVNN